MDNLFKNYPLVDIPNSLRYYYLMTLGYHFYRAIDHIIYGRDRYDFVEMIVHHILTLILYSGSYMMNYMRPGSLVCFCLDQADLLGCLARAYNETVFKRLAAVIGITMWATWVWTRMVQQTKVIYYAIYLMPNQVPTWPGSDEKFFMDCFCLFLCFL